MTIAGKQRNHFDLPASAWPRERVYYFCSGCHAVHGIWKSDPPVYPNCGAGPLRDIFAEMAERLRRAFGFFGETCLKENPWLFTMEPGGVDASLFASSMALGAYGELRSMGFTPPNQAPWGSDDEVLKAWTATILAHPDTETNLLSSIPRTVRSIYNWREGPIIRRGRDNRVSVREGITYWSRGHEFTG